MMELSSLLPWLSPLIAVTALTYTILSNRSRAAKDEFVKFQERVTLKEEALLARIDQLEDRVSKTEGELKHLPDKETAHRLEMAVARLEGRLETMDERLKPVAAMAARMQDHLLDGARA
jgi:uncharacterized coiled-coil protein SlyX